MSPDVRCFSVDCFSMNDINIYYADLQGKLKFTKTECVKKHDRRNDGKVFLTTFKFWLFSLFDFF